MILIEFLLAPTVPSAPESVEQRANGLGLFGGEIGIVGEAGVGDVVVDADGEVILRLGFLSSSKTALTIAGVNSFERVRSVRR